MSMLNSWCHYYFPGKMTAASRSVPAFRGWRAEGGLIDCGSGFEIFDEIKKGIRRPVCLSYPLPSGPYFGGVSF